MTYYTKIKRIKAYVRKSYETCDKCKYGVKRYCFTIPCKECECHIEKATPHECYCNNLKQGDPCKHFKKGGDVG